MVRTCTVCSHKALDEINSLLLSGEPYRDIAGQFGLSKTALARHKESHISELLSKSDDLKAEQGNQTLIEVRELKVKALDILAEAQEAGDLKTALMGIREARSCLELCLKAEGQIKDGPQVTIINAPEWVELRTVIIQALDQYPEAREAVVHAIHER
jgi:hypothetical protein